MKYMHTKIIVFIYTFLFFYGSFLFGQDTLSHRPENGIKNKLIITPGVGVNIMGSYLMYSYAQKSNWKSTGDENYQHITTDASLMYNIGVDFGILKFLSMGAAFGYQTAKVNIEAHEHNPVTKVPGHIIDSWKRVNISTRVDYYMIRKKNVLLYTGMKFGINYYSMTSTQTSLMSDYADKLPLTDVKPWGICTQMHFGCSCYFYNVVGFNSEVGLGIGGPYLATLGLSFKI